ncbi:hypothetical protein L249_8014 [Ophiocordyceps polyrhachis-furcata BCC 54312]|uniref:Uncharacterized protein n=1 Tax=Ophiocordyceps polyrhachis-furcata BCC 54312 TaxID=1330021 RepID=A0A367LIJ1_9HYPO|nr:hypothetical protein L249_8014 [Ophiocordyceps polyrhachis-furcata BCC 54312]
MHGAPWYPMASQPTAGPSMSLHGSSRVEGEYLCRRAERPALRNPLQLCRESPEISARYGHYRRYMVWTPLPTAHKPPLWERQDDVSHHHPRGGLDEAIISTSELLFQVAQSLNGKVNRQGRLHTRHHSLRFVPRRTIPSSTLSNLADINSKKMLALLPMLLLVGSSYAAALPPVRSPRYPLGSRPSGAWSGVWTNSEKFPAIAGTHQRVFSSHATPRAPRVNPGILRYAPSLEGSYRSRNEPGDAALSRDDTPLYDRMGSWMSRG